MNIDFGESHAYLGCFLGNPIGRPFFCGAGLTRCSVMPDGEVLGCQQVYDRSLSEGNIRNKPFPQIWKEGFSRFRKRDFPVICRGCAHLSGCQAGCWAEMEKQGVCLKSVWRRKSKPKMRFREPANKTLYRLASLVKRILLLHRSFCLHFVQVEDPASGMHLAYIGEGESLGYLRKTYLGQSNEAEITTIPLWHLKKKIRQLVSKEALIFVEINRMLTTLIPGGGWLTFPWIRQSVSLKSDDYEERRHKIEGSFGRKVRKFNYRFQISREKESVVRFYHELYLPYITARFGDEAHLRSLSELQAVLRSGFLLQVFSEDLWVSGAMCRVKKGNLSVIAFGHLPAPQYEFQQGALGAAYYFISKWAEGISPSKSISCEAGLMQRTVSMNSKRRWGARSEIDSWPHTALWIFRLKGSKIPQSIKSLLIWTGNGFIDPSVISNCIGPGHLHFTDVTKPEKHGNRKVVMSLSERSIENGIGK